MNNSSNLFTEGELMTNDDSSWVLTCAFLVFTMQTGFAMLETGCVAPKNTTNTMVKNCCDVVVGGVAFWIFGYALAYGRPANSFIAFGDFCFSVDDDDPQVGTKYSKYFFQLSFASTATTIASGAVAERMKLRSFMVFSFVNVAFYAVPAHWCWDEMGFLAKLGFFDFAGACVVHISGGASALVAVLILGPRQGRFEHPEVFQMSSPVTALAGMFMLTWAWLGFNCGSTFGLSRQKWKVATKVAVTTINGAIGGGLGGFLSSMIANKGCVIVDFVLCSVLAGLVSVTSICPVTSPAEAVLIGLIGGLIVIPAKRLLEHLHIDDPVGAIPVHLVAATWGVAAVGIFGKKNDYQDHFAVVESLIYDGNLRLLAVNLLGALLTILWAGFTTGLCMFLLKMTIGVRLSEDEEFLGSDFVEHGYGVDTKGVLDIQDDQFYKMVAAKLQENNSGKTEMNKDIAERVKTILSNSNHGNSHRTPTDVAAAVKKVQIASKNGGTSVKRRLRRNVSASRISVFDFRG